VLEMILLMTTIGGALFVTIILLLELKAACERKQKNALPSEE
jgi:hypothetical protein